MLREALGGRRIAITGATGFLGTALTERLLRSVPDCEVALLVRPGPARRSRPGAPRGPAGTTASTACGAELGDRFDAEMDRRVLVMAGDVGVDGLGLDAAGEELLASCPTVIHSAATVSFDSPLDARRRDQPARARSGWRPPSTGCTAAAPPPSPISSRSRPPTWPAAAGAGRPRPPWPTPPGRPTWPGGRRSTRPAGPGPTPTPTAGTPRCWPASSARPASELGAAGTPLLAAKSERLREDWVKDRLVAARQGPGPGPGLARRLRLHQGPRRAGPARDPGRRCRSRSCARPSSNRPWPSRSRAGSAASAWPTR